MPARGKVCLKVPVTCTGEAERSVLSKVTLCALPPVHTQVTEPPGLTTEELGLKPLSKITTVAVSRAPALSGVPPPPPPPAPPTEVPVWLYGSNVDSPKQPTETIATSARNARRLRRILPPRGNRRERGKTTKKASKRA